MEPIYIPHLLKAPQRTLEFEFQEFLPGLETLTPVRGRMRVTHKSTFLEVATKAETIVNLTCDRCLKQYNHRLAIKTSEILWLQTSTEQLDPDEIDEDIAVEDLVETLSPQGHFSPEDWLYQQLSLALPLRQLCEGPCEVPDLPEQTNPSQPLKDSRWAALEALQKLSVNSEQ